MDQISKEGGVEQALPVLTIHSAHIHIVSSFLFLIPAENASDSTL